MSLTLQILLIVATILLFIISSVFSASPNNL